MEVTNSRSARLSGRYPPPHSLAEPISAAAQICASVKLPVDHNSVFAVLEGAGRHKTDRASYTTPVTLKVIRTTTKASVETGASKKSTTQYCDQHCLVHLVLFKCICTKYHPLATSEQKKVKPDGP